MKLHSPRRDIIEKKNDQILQPFTMNFCKGVQSSHDCMKM